MREWNAGVLVAKSLANNAGVGTQRARRWRRETQKERNSGVLVAKSLANNAGVGTWRVHRKKFSVISVPLCSLRPHQSQGRMQLLEVIMSKSHARAVPAKHFAIDQNDSGVG